MTALAGQRELSDGLSDLVCAVTGMSCGACALRIERELGGVDGVELARVNLSTRRLRLVWRTGRIDPQSLLDRIAALGFDAHALEPERDAGSRSDASILIALGVAAFGTMNVMGFSVAVWTGVETDMGEATRDLMHWISAAIALPTAAYSGRIFYRPAWRALSHGRFSMDVAITLAIAATLAASMFETWRGGEEAYFDAALSLILFLLIGRWLDQALRRRSAAASDNLRRLADGDARRLNADGDVETVRAEDLVVGDEVFVKPGDRLPADGVAISAPAEIDESLLTGEATPRRIGPGEAAPAGALAVGAAFSLRVTATGEATRLAAIAALTEAAEQHRGAVQLRAERFAAAYGPLVVGAATGGFLLWRFFLGAEVSEALMIAVAILIVTCPCAAGLATPAVAARAVNLALSRGVIIRDGGAMERLAEVERAVIDKTGTLTSAMACDLSALPPADADLAATMAAASAHPMARAVTRARTRAPLAAVRDTPGEGLQAPCGARLGSAEFTGAPRGSSASLWFARPGAAPAPLPITDRLRPGARALARKLAPLNPLLLSGDRQDAVRELALDVGISDWRAGMTPEGKLETLDGLDMRVLMIGDGLNDAPAMAAAHVSAAPASAADATRMAADLVIIGDRLDAVADVWLLSKRARRLIGQNLGFAALYNILTVPLALAGGLTPLIAAALMSSSSVLVMLNALRLRAAP